MLLISSVASAMLRPCTRSRHAALQYNALTPAPLTRIARHSMHARPMIYQLYQAQADLLQPLRQSPGSAPAWRELMDIGACTPPLLRHLRREL